MQVLEIILFIIAACWMIIIHQTNIDSTKPTSYDGRKQEADSLTR